eukprot:Hpha_TRINITY_DN15927_c7_g2::TRINITY_DN15927_c7_g2_i1::g.74258::m.74258
MPPGVPGSGGRTRDAGYARDDRPRLTLEHRPLGTASAASYCEALGSLPPSHYDGLYTGARNAAPQRDAMELARELVAIMDDLPEPLIPQRSASQFLVTLSIADSSERMSQLKLLVQGLRPDAKELLGSVLSHLHLVARRQGGGDGLAAGAAALSRAPSPWPRILFKSLEKSVVSAANQQRISSVLALMIEHSRFLLDALPGTGGYISSSHSSPQGPRETHLRGSHLRNTSPPPLSPANVGFPVTGSSFGEPMTPARSESPDDHAAAAGLVDQLLEGIFADPGLVFDSGFRVIPGNRTAHAQQAEREQVMRIEANFSGKHRRPELPPQPTAPRTGSWSRRQDDSAIATGAVAPGAWQGLQQTIAQLNSRRTPQQRTPAAIRDLGDQQLMEEKKTLKQALRGFDSDFERVVGRTPEKTDKEPLRAVYAYYKELKREMDKRGQFAKPGSVLARAMAEEQQQQGQEKAEIDPFTLSARRSIADTAPSAPAPQPTTTVPRTGSAGQLQRRIPSTPAAPPPPPDLPAAAPPVQQQPAPRADPTPAPPAQTQASGGLNTGSGLAVPSSGIGLPRDVRSLTPAQIQSLRQEKRAIKRHLFAFMAQFREEHGREVKTREDRAPCAGEYERYRLLKTLLQEIDGPSAEKD